LHFGHIHCLANAADKGDLLVVGLNSDDSITRLKGKKRPINSQQHRAQIICSLYFVNAVVIFEQDTPYELIKFIEPDVLVKGGDWKLEEVVGADIVKKKGGKVETIPYLENLSTSRIIEQQQKI
jgi:D-beta-D-heptose 7-phosphate kinase/D-beta-D-heptose 1-phosphate adenosyltransferase